MSSKTTWILLALVVAGAVYLLFLEDFLGIGTTDERQRRERRLLTLRPDTVRAITVREASQTIELRRDPDGWTMTSPVTAMADSAAIDGILAQITTLDRESNAAGDVDLASFGLAEPEIDVTLVTDDASTRLAIGDETPLGGRRYVRVDAGDIDVVDESVWGLFHRTPLEFRDRDVFAYDPFDADRVELVRDGLSTVLVRGDDRFRVGDPAIDDADQATVRDLLYRMSGLDALGFLPETATSDRYGLEAPIVTIVMTHPDAPGPERLVIGSPATEHPAAYYGRADRFPGEIVLVPEEILRDIRGDRDDFRSPLLVDLTARQVRALRFGEGSTAVHVQRSERRGRTSASPWRITSPVEIDAEPSTVDALIEALGRVPVRRYVADRLRNPEDYGLAPGRRITIETASAPETFIAGRLDDEGRFLYVSRTPEGPLLAVDAEVTELLPESVVDLRTRNVASIDLWEPITIELERDGRRYTVESENLAFTISEPVTAPLDTRVAQGLEAVLAPLRATRIVTLDAAADLDRYGLTDPRIRLNARIRPTTRPAYEVGLAIGSSDDNGHAYARTADSPLVFTLPPDTVSLLEAEWIERQLVEAAPSDVGRIRTNRGERDVHLVRTGSEWSVRAPEDSRANAAAIEDLAEALASLSVVRFALPDPGDTTTGLDAPGLVLRFEVERDATAEEFTVSLGNPAPGGGTFARVSNAPAIAVLDETLVARMRAELVALP